MDKTLAGWIDAHVHAFAYFGDAPPPSGAGPSQGRREQGLPHKFSSMHARAHNQFGPKRHFVSREI